MWRRRRRSKKFSHHQQQLQFNPEQTFFILPSDCALIRTLTLQQHICWEEKKKFLRIIEVSINSRWIFKSCAAFFNDWTFDSLLRSELKDVFVFNKSEGGKMDSVLVKFDEVSENYLLKINLKRSKALSDVNK